jgi:ATP-dependent Zn protease
VARDQGRRGPGAARQRLLASGVAVEQRDLNLSRGVSYQNPNSFWSSVFLIGGPWILILIFFFFFMRQMRNQGAAGGVMSFGRSRAQLYTKENHTNVTFDDVAGATRPRTRCARSSSS